ncbi:MAG: serine/threonine-protein phosphatase [Lachnospiraceae bacterium]|nr:serine/threonine-protein phosphatase [Lachnospiraceae bacterium]
MGMDNEEYSYYEENQILRLSIQSIIGDRAEQQDASGYEMMSDGAMVVVCDGMGGHDGGRLASQITVRAVKDTFRSHDIDENISLTFVNAMIDADGEVYSLKKPDGSRMNAGSTVVAIRVKGSRLHWLAAGDSRIYLYRNEELCIANVSHTYKWKLDRQLLTGEITEEEYRKQLPFGDQLVSYVGTGYADLQYMDVNNLPFILMNGDRILLTTDGLFKILKDEEIKNILSNFKDIREAARALITKTRRKGDGHLDNVTIAIIEIK